MKFQVHGQLGGRKVKKTLSVVHQSLGAAAVSGLTHGALGHLGVRGVAAMTARDPSKSDPNLEKAMQGCLANLRLWIEEQGPRAASKGGDAYRQVKWTSVAIGIGSGLISAMVASEELPGPLWMAAVPMGAVAGGMLGLAAYFMMLARMSADFFRNAPRGRWLMSMHRTSSLPALRTQLFILALLSGLFGLFVAGLPIIGKAFREQGHAPNAAPQQLPPRMRGRH